MAEHTGLVRFNKIIKKESNGWAYSILFLVLGTSILTDFFRLSLGWEDKDHHQPS